DHPANLVHRRLSGVAFKQSQRIIEALRSARPDDLFGTIKTSLFQLFKLIEPPPLLRIIGGHVAPFPEIQVHVLSRLMVDAQVRLFAGQHKAAISDRYILEFGESFFKLGYHSMSAVHLIGGSGQFAQASIRNRTEAYE